VVNKGVQGRGVKVCFEYGMEEPRVEAEEVGVDRKAKSEVDGEGFESFVWGDDVEVLNRRGAVRDHGSKASGVRASKAFEIASRKSVSDGCVYIWVLRMERWPRASCTQRRFEQRRR